MMDIAKVVTKARFWYHANMLSVYNALNQLHIVSDETAEQRNEYHAMTIFNDVFPRLGYDVSKLMKEKEDEAE